MITDDIDADMDAMSRAVEVETAPITLSQTELHWHAIEWFLAGSASTAVVAVAIAAAFLGT